MYAESTTTHAPSEAVSGVIAMRAKLLTEKSYSVPFSTTTFGIMENKYLKLYSSEYFLNVLQRYCFDKLDADGNRLPYDEIRTIILFAQIMLNLKGEIAPRFRPMRSPCKPGGGVDYPTEHILLSNDRQFIDLHWIYCQQLNANSIVGYKFLFDKSKPFDITLAENFVAKAGGYERKSNLLGLPEIQQFQLASLQSQNVKTRWKTIKGYCERNQSKLKDIFINPKSKYPREVINDSPDIHKSILITRGSPSDALKVFKLMTGKNQNVKNFQRYVKKLNNVGLII